MDIHIQPLNSSNQDDYFGLFADDSFGHQKEWKNCFCRFYHTECTVDEWLSRTGEFNREEAVQEIAKGRMKGYLAYDEKLCVGWVNVAEVTLYKRLWPYLEDRFKNDKTALAICFVIRETHRGQKIASKLLDYAIEELTKQGMDVLISAPHDFKDPEKNYRGPKAMYIHRGFEEYVGEDGTTYMILKLQ